MAAIKSRKYTSGFRFCDCTHLRRWKFICIPNFGDVSQSKVETKLIPVRENARPPYSNSIYGLVFYLCIVIGMLFCICLPNFIVIGRIAADEIISIFQYGGHTVAAPAQ